MPFRVFNIDEVGRYLRLDRAYIERLVKNQEIPFEKRGSRLVFRKIDIDTWASQRIVGMEGGRLADYHSKTTRATAAFLPHQVIMPDMIKPQFINPALPAKTKASALREMVALAARTGRVSDERALLDSIQAREDLCSTGMPGGLAVPHPRNPDPAVIETPFIVLGRTVHPIPFGAPDGAPTDLFFLLGCPDDRLHLHTLARLCLMALKTDLLDRLRQLSTPDEMCEEIVQSEDAVLKASVGKSSPA